MRSGVRQIISVNSPPGSREDVAEFLSSTHPMREICFVAEGSSRYMFNGSVYDAQPGTAFLIDSWVHHALGYRKKDHGLLHLWIHFFKHNPNFCVARFQQVSLHGEYRIAFKPFSFYPEFGKVLTRRWNLLNALDSCSPEMVMEYMRQPLNMILDEILLQLQHKDRVVRELKGNPVIEALKKYILTSNARDCSYQRLEQISGYSRFYLAHCFREQESCSIGEYIDCVRISYTAAAMQRGLRQKEIAFELGFSSPSNFWNWFHKHEAAIRKEIESSGNILSK